MRKYLGSKITAFAAIIAPLFLFCPLLLGVSALCAEVSGATIFLTLGGVTYTLIWGLYIKKISDQIYSWGYFYNESIQVKTAFSKMNTIVYEKCKGCGIGYYIHGVLNTKAGTKVFFIFFSYDMFDEAYRSNMNLWKPSPTRIKVEFNKKLYDYLITVLPPKQSLMLRRDFKKYIE